MLWVPVTLMAAMAQILRNFAQSGLTRSLGTLGATQVRFVYGLPFALVFLALVCLAQGRLPPLPGASAFGLIALGGVAQIAATALMLAVMEQRGFAVSTAWIKTEPVLIALGAVLILGEHLAALQWLGVIVATLGVIITGWRPGQARVEAGPLLTGLAAAAGFGLSALAFRAGILALGDGDFLLRAMTALALSLAVQVGLLTLWLGRFRPGAITATLDQWRGSVAAGFLGAFGSALWFTAFALTSAASVRTLALIEVLLAAALARILRGERPGPRQLAGMAVIVAGVALLLVHAAPVVTAEG